MKLLTLNCHSWQEANQIEKIKCLAETIKEKSYDVIALQEVSQSITEQIVEGIVKKDNFCYLLIQELNRIGAENYQYVWDFAHIGYEKYEEGIALVTKHKIDKDVSFFVSQSKDTSYWKTRKIVGIKISFNNQPVSFYSCHLGWWEDEEEPFKQQIDTLCDYVRADELAFLMGDFNNAASAIDGGYEYIIAQGLYDTFHLAESKDKGATISGNIAGWDSNKHNLRIDYIFTNKPVSVQKSNIIFDGINKPIISDHFGVELTIKS